MEMETTAEGGLNDVWNAVSRMGKAAAALAIRIAVLAALGAAWLVSGGALYSPGSGVGYWLGVVGASLMLVPLLYPLRKRVRRRSILGPLKRRFRVDLFAGILGPVAILFHSIFHVDSFSAGIALASMLLVVASGTVGHYLYLKIHDGLCGSRANAAELKRVLAQQLEALRPLLARLPFVAAEFGRYSALVQRRPIGSWERVIHFASLGCRRRAAAWRVRRAIGYYSSDPYGVVLGSVHDAAETLDATLAAIQRSAQFATYERLFSRWHALHIPFLLLLVIAALMHVAAVHAY